jgi:flagellar biosynthetic protein FlhB
MADEDQDQKTEAPTGKRLDEAREHGQIPVSRETSAWVVLVGVLLVVAWMLPTVARHMVDFMRVFLEAPHTFPLDENNAQSLMFMVLGQLTKITGLVFALLMVAAVAGVMVQTGFFFSLDLLIPDFTRLMPARGLKKLFSLGSVVELLKSFGKLVFLGAIAFFMLMPVAKEAPQLMAVPLMDTLLYLDHKAVHLLVLLILGFTIIAVIDFFYTRFQYIRNLRMTKTEVKDEFKQQEGDPMIKNRLRQIRMEKARKRMMAQVPKADVVVTNPTHYAIAMQYDSTKMAAPVVLAKGTDNVAERIRAVAEEHKIPLVSNPPLARVLYDTVEVD